ncbi:MAG: hypothetical protein LAT82_05050 [Nanoarchaeota archaeon]|nr:hypothetical protein [Nanoarchaeota archaeon]
MKTKQNKNQNKLIYTQWIKVLFGALLVLIIIPLSFSQLELVNVYFDPAIITAGDEVDVVIEYRARNVPFESNQIGSGEYTYQVRLIADSELANEHITIIDSSGKDVKGGGSGILQGVTYNKVFRIKVDTNAQALNYPLKLEGQWFRNNVAQRNTEFVRFDLPVKKEGIILDIAGISSMPNKIRPGNTEVLLQAHLENSGFKTAQSIEILLESESSGIVASFSNNNRQWVGLLDEKTSKPLQFYIDVRDSVQAGVHNLYFTINYKDMDGNSYTKNSTIPIIIESRPNLVVTHVEGSSRAGEKAQMIVEITNIGEDIANAVDVRIIRDSSQPFAFDIRTNFIGQIRPNETRTAVFEFDTLSSAEEKLHQFQLLIRAQGDTDKGDSSIYTFNRRAEFEVSGQAPNIFITIGVGVVIIVVVLFVIALINRKRTSSSPQKK